MKKIKLALKPLGILSLLAIAFTACENDFSNLNSDLVNRDNAAHFNAETIEYPIIAYSKILDPVQTNNLPANLFGVYDDPVYGRTTASFISQLTPSTYDPSFGENVVIDSVVITIPYYSSAVGYDEDGETLYELDSVFGSGSFNFKIYESNYFLRSFNPEADFDTSEQYFSNGTNSNGEVISNSLIEGELIYETESPFQPSEAQIVLMEENEEGEMEVSNRLTPALRLVFDESSDLDFWQEKIIDMEGQTELSNQNNFTNYFRGLYFKAEPENEGVMALLNLTSTNANINIYYTQDSSYEEDERIQNTYTLSFSPNRVNLFENNFNITLQDGDDTNGDANLYLKGGEGSMAIINLFEGEDLDDAPGDNAFEEFKRNFAELDEDGKFVKSKRLINEANLIFYVNQDIVNGQEPERIYLYDLKNNTPLIDFYYDASSSDPLYTRSNHLGKLEREGNESSGEGVKYKFKITEHIKNLIENDSTNVKLGLVVADNINIEGELSQYSLQTEDEEFNKIPRSTIISPKGTVLHGNASPDDNKRVYLQIYYTEPNN